MPRKHRIILPGLPHHITQRGNGRSDVFRDGNDREVYLQLLARFSNWHTVDLFSYCLMTNHVHLVGSPLQEDSVAKMMRDLQGFYAIYYNRKYGLTGHLWQGRFFSCVLDPDHFQAAIRYVERNPVRAGLVARAESFCWSSAAAHCGLREDPLLAPLNRQWISISDWLGWLSLGDYETGDATLREATRTGCPWGSEEFVEEMEQQMGRFLKPRKAGRPRKRNEVENRK
jgi:putative transposase